MSSKIYKTRRDRKTCIHYDDKEVDGKNCMSWFISGTPCNRICKFFEPKEKANTSGSNGM